MFCQKILKKCCLIVTTIIIHGISSLQDQFMTKTSLFFKKQMQFKIKLIFLETASNSDILINPIQRDRLEIVTSNDCDWSI